MMSHTLSSSFVSVGTVLTVTIMDFFGKSVKATYS